jgi:hypothetical protein
MTDATPSWDALNARYLQAGVRWVRAKLEHLAALQEKRERPAPPRRRLVRRRGVCGWLFGGREVLDSPRSPPALPPDWSADEVAAREEMEQVTGELSGADLPKPALPALAERFRLSGFETDLLLLGAAAELNYRIDALCGRAQGDPRRSYPTLNLALALFAPTREDWQALAPHARLRWWMLVEVTQPPGNPLLTAAIRIDPRALEYLQGSKRIDARLTALGTLHHPNGIVLPDSRREAARRVEHIWSGPEAGWPVVRLAGPDRDGNLAVARRSAGRRQLFRLAADRVPVSPAEVDLLVRLWERERRLFALVLYVEADAAPPSSGDGERPPGLPPVARLVDQATGPVMVAGRDPLPTPNRLQVVVEVARPTVPEQKELWKAALGLPDDLRAGRLAAQFSLDESAIQAIAAAVLASFPHPPDRPPVRPDPDRAFGRAWDECRARTRPAVDGLAQRVEPAARWDDLVLSPAAEGQLRELVAQVGDRWRVYDEWHMRARLNRGLGVSALFAGESGTGKTTAAEVVAGLLRLDLYRIDLSAVVNKYIGETEKNLRRVFDAFEDGGAVLFFDEADALFGKRTDVKDSHDRYANIEVSYLLQRLESYRGLAILATNHRGAIDASFLRRLRFVVTFPTPDAGQRERLWARMFDPVGRPGIPTEHLDYEWLSKFDKLTGGTIHSAAVHAAFLAAQRARPAVTTADVLDAIRAEYAKLNQSLRPADLVPPKPPADRPAAGKAPKPVGAGGALP